jgi:hypothetical protein
MASQSHVLQDVNQAKQALRDRASSYEPLKLVIDNPIKSISTGFLIGSYLSGTSPKRLPKGLLPMLFKASSRLISVVD